MRRNKSYRQNSFNDVLIFFVAAVLDDGFLRLRQLKSKLLRFQMRSKTLRIALFISSAPSARSAKNIESFRTDAMIPPLGGWDTLLNKNKRIKQVLFPKEAINEHVNFYVFYINSSLLYLMCLFFFDHVEEGEFHLWNGNTY
uniref:Uncharacterized protein n=1 Tax=Ananas comosus var. bracteatus TaxID=296719 RepID=A0A6V7QJR7_ANACO|nr:unnamed protein product [Ananas comosus var. bracteatus]